MTDTFDDLPDLDLSINELELDREWQRQPQLVLDWTRHHADAILAADEAKAKLDVVRAVVDKEIRADPAEYDIAKPTEAAVALAVTDHPQTQKAIKRYNQARHRSNVLSGVVSAIEDRRRALQKMVDLHGTAYFGTAASSGGAQRDAPTPAGVRRTRSRKDDDDDDD